ncbi:MAG: hypothetical protein J2P26_04060 [Nocardiopsaceae bacterium]|nr:hypothetical protein [Nocardiopsaceae bacterium]
MTATSDSERATADLAPDDRDVDGRAVVTIAMLAADAMLAAGSGHPGLPMGAAAPACSATAPPSSASPPN